MMAEATEQLRPFDGAAIPQTLKDQPRWAPWQAVFNAKRGKFDKIPHRADIPEHRLSTANPDRWFTYKAAAAAYLREQPSFAGVGYVMTRPHGVVGIDLDGCVREGAIEAWAADVVAALGSYTEISPSGKGLRIFCAGAADDWTNHTVGIEVYGGAEPRFLTITGAHLLGSPLDLREPPSGALEALRAQYGRETSTPKASLVDMPELLDDFMLPDLNSLGLPYAARDFLADGDTRGDRSRELHAAAVALYQAGRSDDEVFSILAASPHAMEVALDHRRQDGDRALAYLWQEHCVKAKGKGGSRIASPDDFEVVSPTNSAMGSTESSSTAIESGASRPIRFHIEPVQSFLQRPPAQWIIKGVLPQAGLAVLFGESGSGKTFFALDLVASVARGEPWRGRTVKAGRVVYVCAEGEAGFRNRLRAYLEFNALDDVPMGVLPDAPNLLEKTDVKDLLVALRAFGPASIIVIDTFAQVMPGANENSGEDMGRALAHCRALHRATGALVVLVHHSGKDSSKGARGWSGLRAAADVELEVERSDDARSVRVTKMKDGEDGAEFGFRLSDVEIGTDEEGQPIRSCVVSHGQVEKKKAAPKGDKQKLVLRVAQDMCDLADQVTPADLVEACVAQIPADDTPGKRDNRRRDVLRALESLIAGGRLGLQNGTLIAQ